MLGVDAFTEQMKYLKANGFRVVSVAEFVDVPDAHLTNLGAKGLGEPPIVPTAAAIANAIRDATGADVRSLPIDRAEMLRALREADEGRREAESRRAVEAAPA